jgi:hypothetical protein
MIRFSKRPILCGLGILLAVGVVVGIALLSSRNSATGDTGALAKGGVESIPRKTTAGCEIGGVPAMKAKRTSGPMGDLVAGPIVIGCGRRLNELIQLVAFRTTKQLCTEMERPSKGRIVGGVCKPIDLAWPDYCADLCIASVLPADIGPRRRYEHSTLFGEAKPELRSIKAVLHGPDRTRVAPTIEGRVESDALLEALDESEPFVVFGTLVQLCVPPPDVEVVATKGRSGVVRSREELSLPHACIA